MKNRPFLKCGCVGLLVIAMSLALLFLLPSKQSVGNMPEGFVTPILAFEFVQTPVEVAALFGAEASPQRQDLVAAMDLGNKLDYAYMALYALFLGWFSLICARLTGNRFFYFPAALSAVALVGDALENVQLLSITAKLSTLEINAELAALQAFTWIKWGSLAIIFLLLSPYFFKGNWFSKIIGGVGVACVVAGGVSFFHRSAANEVFGALTGVMFLLMILYSFIFRHHAD
jgi:hypothetical protein